MVSVWLEDVTILFHWNSLRTVAISLGRIGSCRRGGGAGVHAESYTREARFLTRWDQHAVALRRPRRRSFQIENVFLRRRGRGESPRQRPLIQVHQRMWQVRDSSEIVGVECRSGRGSLCCASQTVHARLLGFAGIVVVLCKQRSTGVSRAKMPRG